MATTVPFGLTLTLLAFQLNFDFTWFCSFRTDEKSVYLMWIIVFIFFLIVALGLGIKDNKIKLILLLIVLTLFISLMIIYDTQLVIGRRHEFVYRVTASLQAEFSISFWMVLLYALILCVIRLSEVFNNFS